MQDSESVSLSEKIDNEMRLQFVFWSIRVGRSIDLQTYSRMRKRTEQTVEIERTQKNSNKIVRCFNKNICPLKFFRTVLGQSKHQALTRKPRGPIVYFGGKAGLITCSMFSENFVHSLCKLDSFQYPPTHQFISIQICE